MEDRTKGFNAYDDDHGSNESNNDGTHAADN